MAPSSSPIPVDDWEMFEKKLNQRCHMMAKMVLLRMDEDGRDHTVTEDAVVMKIADIWYQGGSPIHEI